MVVFASVEVVFGFFETNVGAFGSPFSELEITVGVVSIRDVVVVVVAAAVVAAIVTVGVDASCTTVLEDIVTVGGTTVLVGGLTIGFAVSRTVLFDIVGSVTAGLAAVVTGVTLEEALRVGRIVLAIIAVGFLDIISISWAFDTAVNFGKLTV